MATLGKQSIYSDRQVAVIQFICMLYVSMTLIAMVLSYKIVGFFGSPISTATFLVPFNFMLLNLATEIYGYRIAKRIVWYAFLCQLLFSGGCYVLIHTFPSEATVQASYQSTFDNLPRVFFSKFIAELFGVFINIYCLSRWKVLTHGKFFWFRCIFATLLGLTVATSIIIFSLFIGKEPLSAILHLLWNTLLFKFAMEPIVAGIAVFLLFLIRLVDDTDVYDKSVSYNPFKL